MLTLIVIGLGSMGKRRIRLMQQLGFAHTIVGVDSSIARCEDVKDMCHIETYTDLSIAINMYNPDIALVCTSPLSHGDIVIQCLSSGMDVFTEINLLNNWYKKALELAKEKDLKIFISSTPLYRKEIEYIQSKVHGDAVSYTYHCGQYLPDWHPWENYKDFFVHDKRTNGCRELFAIEMPWIIKTFGKVTKWHAVKSKLSSLHIDFPDTFHVVFEHETGSIGTVCFDIVSRKASRKLEISSEELYLSWDGTHDSLCEYNFTTKQCDAVSVYDVVEQDKRYASNIIETAYTDELRNFFDYLDQKSLPKYSFMEDYELLNLINAIEGHHE